ncbi:uncharacterized protein LOC121780296 [Salvia splendens]|uniref:uncharacterized protein LOC121780296 n=1 Tax=Salvia splendens TaxID=180675 RepID=UPI001103F39E|nr:uncharacterized protein LOC121780296 [Salvia splendens]
MLKKMMAMVASKVMAIKDRMRAIETHLIIQSLLLRDKRMVRHLFHRRNQVKQFDIVEEDDDVLLPGDPEFALSNSVVTSPASMVQVAEEIEDTMDMEDDYDDVYTEEEEGKGEEFKLEDDIDKVADLFIQRFHHQIWLQKQQSEEGIHA